MLTIACVLKSGGKYTPTDVRRLFDGLVRNCNHPFALQCLTDVVDQVGQCLVQSGIPYQARHGTVDSFTGFESVTYGGGKPTVVITPLVKNWPGWWSKMNLFQLQGPLLYFDLDTVIVGDISKMARYVEKALANTHLLMLRDFYRPQIEATGVMGWSGNMSQVYTRFFHFGQKKVLAPMRPRDGDQDWIRENIPREDVPRVFAQDLWPGLIRSYKREVQQYAQITPPNAGVVCFHGDPRPWALLPQPAWLKEHWGPPDPRKA